MRLVLLATAIQLAFFSSAVATESQSQTKAQPPTPSKKTPATPIQIRTEIADPAATA
jgi:hypothetical protein